MEAYRDWDRDSGVEAFEIGGDSITIRFRKGGTYLYTYASAGASAIERMKVFARAGDGLNSYILSLIHI